MVDNTYRRRPGLHPAVIALSYIMIVAAPLILAVSTGRTGRGLIKDFAHAIGMIAYDMLLAQFVLSSRFEAVSGHIGIDVLMRFHQLAARTLAVLIVLHPILMTGRVAILDVYEAPNYFLSIVQNPKFLTGIIAFLLVLTLIATSLGRRFFKIPYEIWRALHGLLALGIAGFGWHHAISVGRYSKNSPLAKFWTILFALAAATLVFIYFIKPLLLLRHPYRVVSNDKIGEKIHEITLTPNGNHQLRYAPGQFAWVNFRKYPFSLLDHPFSIASNPTNNKNISFIIQEDGDFTKNIESIPKGHVAYLDAPHGNFTLAGRNGTAIGLIAGGVGIAPILSILRYLRATNDPRPIRLIYGAKKKNKLISVKEIEKMKIALDLQTTYALFDPPINWPGKSGNITHDMIRTAINFPTPSTALYFLCGPPRLIETAEECLLKMNVPLNQIIYERFTFD